MNWLIPSIIANMTGTAILSACYLYLYPQDKQTYLKTWGISWVVYFSRYVFMLGILLWQKNEALLICNQLASLVSGVLLLYGSYQFVNRKFPAFLWPVSLLGAAWIVVSVSRGFSFMVMSLPTFGFLAIIYIWTGILFCRSREIRKPERMTLGWAFIIWGVHKADYPFVRPILWLAPWGYLLAAVLELIVAIGLLFIYFSKTRESLNFQAMLLNHIQDHVTATDLVGNILYVNEAELRTTQRSREDLVGASVDIYGEDPEKGATQQEIIDYTMAHGAWRGEVVNYAADGREIIMDCRTRLIRDTHGRPWRMVGISTDITDRKRAEAAFWDSEKRFRELFDHMSSGVAIYDTPDNGKHFVFKDLNRSGLSAAGLKKHEVVGREVRAVFPGVEELGLLSVLRQVWQTGIPMHHPSRMYRDDRLTLWVENYVCRLPSGELVAIYEDTTEKRRAEEAKEALERQLLQSQKIESIGNLAGGIAHDFNNLLFPIIGMAELLMEDLPRDGQAHDNAREIFEAGKRGRDLVKQILAFSRQTDHQKGPVRLQNIIREVVKLSRSTIPAGIELDRDLSPDCGLVDANGGQMHQVVMNLVTNAFHAVDETRGRIRVRLEEVRVETDPLLEPGRYALLSVSDNGTGIAQVNLDRIFEPYFTTKENGTGLGLAVVYGIIREHKGDIRVASEPGNGATFKVYLPLIQKKAETPENGGSSQTAAGTERILLVDDEEAIARLGSQMLERQGYTVETHTDSPDALAAFESDPAGYELVITDMTMPHMTGDRLAREILRIRPDIPVIICTGFSERINEHMAKRMGIRGFLMKPVVKSEMLSMVRQVLDQD